MFLKVSKREREREGEVLSLCTVLNGGFQALVLFFVFLDTSSLLPSCSRSIPIPLCTVLCGVCIIQGFVSWWRASYMGIVM